MDCEQPPVSLPPLPYWIDELAGTATRVSKRPVDVGRILWEGVGEGERDAELFRLAAKLRGAGVDYDSACELVERAADRCNPPFEDWQAKVDSAYRRYSPSPVVAMADTAEVTRDTVLQMLLQPRTRGRGVAQRTNRRRHGVRPVGQDVVSVVGEWRELSDAQALLAITDDVVNAYLAAAADISREAHGPQG
jgi:hypothetical protein